jgi:hypothetical protein
VDVVIAYLDDRNAWAAERLAREPGWVLDAALSHAGNSKVFATYLHSVSAHEIAELGAKAAVAARDKKTAGAKAPADPLAVAKRERDAQLRELTDQAHGANLDLGHALIHNLTTVDPADMDVARFFVLCGDRHRTNYADFATMPMRCAAAARGRRSVVESAGGATCSWRRAGQRQLRYVGPASAVLRVRGRRGGDRERGRAVGPDQHEIKTPGSRTGYLRARRQPLGSRRRCLSHKGEYRCSAGPGAGIAVNGRVRRSHDDADRSRGTVSAPSAGPAADAACSRPARRP